MIPDPRPSDVPAITEVVLHRWSGVIRASGYLTRSGADLLRGAADGLRGAGHSTVVLDLARVRAADDAGLDILHELRASFSAAGGRLLILAGPVGARPVDGAEGVGVEPTAAAAS